MRERHAIASGGTQYTVEAETNKPPTSQAEPPRPGAPPRLRIWPPFLIFFLFTFGVGIAGYFAFREIDRTAHEKAEQTLSAVADLKVRQIGDWLDERRANAERVSRSPFMGPETEAWLARGAPPNDRTAGRLRSRLMGFHETHHWDRVYLVDPQGDVKLNLTNGREASPDLRRLALRSMQTRKVIFLDIDRDPAAGPQASSFGFVAPLLVNEGGERAVASVVMEMDPDDEILALVESWPLPSRSGESLLARREGDSVLYISRLRNRPGSRLDFRLPLASPDLVAAKAIDGVKGPMGGVDYRNVPVLACARAVPATPWILIAKVDRDEIEAPIRKLARLVAWFVLVLIIAAAVGTWSWLHHQRTASLLRQVHAERERAVLARHLEYLTRYANDIILLADEEGRILDVNERAIAAYGYDREELIGSPVGSLRAEETASTFSAEWSAAKSHDEFLFETIHKRRDGTTFPVEVSSRAIKIEGLSFRQGIVRDLTERNDAERRIVKLGNLVATAIEQANDAVIVTDAEGVIEYVNPAFEKASGWQLGEVIGLTPRILKSGVQDDGFYHSLWKQLKRGDAWSGQFVNRRKDGSMYEVEASISPIFNEAKVISGFVGLQRDKTELLALLDRVYRSEEMVRIGKLISGVAHEVRNPLNAIQAALAALESEIVDTEENRHLLKAVRSQVRHLADLMRELLDFSKPIDRSRVELHSVDALCNEAIALWRSSHPDVAADRVQLEPPAATTFVEVDAGRMHQVLMNLLDNAHQHSPSDTPIVLRTTTANGHVRIQMIDRGSGIAPENLGRVFDPFFTTRRRGTGLGLSLVKNIVEQHGGTVVLRNNQPGPGCTAEITLETCSPVEELEHASETAAR